MKFLITAGGTREYIDPVRYITNASSGQMGYNLAKAAIKAGHEVTLISAPTNIKPAKGVKIINVLTSDDMFKAVKENLPEHDCLIMAAAVSDYKPAKMSKTKIKKHNQTLTLELKPTRDILKWAGTNGKDKLIVGFALEDTDLKENAEKKLINKKIDIIVANSPAAIGASESRLFIKSKCRDWVEIWGNKRKTAVEIIKYITNSALSSI